MPIEAYRDDVRRLIRDDRGAASPTVTLHPAALPQVTIAARARRVDVAADASGGHATSGDAATSVPSWSSSREATT